MEWNLRLVLLIVVLVLLIIILVDGYLRSRRKSKIKMRAKPTKPHNQSAHSEEESLREILGPARIISRPDHLDTDDFADKVPTLLDAEEDHFSDVIVTKKIDIKQTSNKQYDIKEEQAELQFKEKQQDLFNLLNTLDSSDSSQLASESSSTMQSEQKNQQSFEQTEQRQPHKIESKLKEKALSQQYSREQLTKKQQSAKTVQPDHMLVLFVAATDTEIDGNVLLEILLEENCRLGEMNIFHRYEKENGEGGSLFSISNAVKPWKFNINNMEEETYKGLCLLMNLPGPQQNMVPVFNDMVSLAKKIAERCQARVLDDKRSVITDQTIAHYCQSITEYQHKQRIKR